YVAYTSRRSLSYLRFSIPPYLPVTSAPPTPSNQISISLIPIWDSIHATIAICALALLCIFFLLADQLDSEHRGDCLAAEVFLRVQISLYRKNTSYQNLVIQFCIFIHILFPPFSFMYRPMFFATDNLLPRLLPKPSA